jgi:hypothetical protein
MMVVSVCLYSRRRPGEKGKYIKEEILPSVIDWDYRETNLI